MTSTVVRLRPTTDADLDFVVAAESAPENRPFIFPWSRERHLEGLADDDLLHRIVEPAEAAGPPVRLGFVIIAGLRNEHGNIEFLRLVITEKGRGYGRAAIRAVKRLAFGDLQAHRLWLDVIPDNTRARDLYTSEGFVLEGVLRECVRGERGFESLAILSILAREEREREGAR
jgi:RimJ/RimL family protein N-acetyltransferase